MQSSELGGSKQRIILTDQQAVEIFMLKDNHGYSSKHTASTQLSREYKVSPKAIRDIWKGRSWLNATSHLWKAEDLPPRKIPGRPRGKKDSQPRKRKTPEEETDRLNLAICAEEREQNINLQSSSYSCFHPANPSISNRVSADGSLDFRLRDANIFRSPFGNRLAAEVIGPPRSFIQNPDLLYLMQNPSLQPSRLDNLVLPLEVAPSSAAILPPVASAPQHHSPSTCGLQLPPLISYLHQLTAPPLSAHDSAQPPSDRRP